MEHHTRTGPFILCCRNLQNIWEFDQFQSQPRKFHPSGILRLKCLHVERSDSSVGLLQGGQARGPVIRDLSGRLGPLLWPGGTAGGSHPTDCSPGPVKISLVGRRRSSSKGQMTRRQRRLRAAKIIRRTREAENTEVSTEWMEAEDATDRAKTKNGTRKSHSSLPSSMRPPRPLRPWPGSGEEEALPSKPNVPTDDEEEIVRSG